MARIKKIEAKSGGIAYKIEILKGTEPDGRRVFHYETYKPTAKGEKAAYKEAVTYAENLENRIKSGEIIVSDKLTFADLIDEWKKSNRYKDLSTSCRETYDDMLNYPELDDLKRMKVRLLNVRYMQSVIDSLGVNVKNGRPRSPSTVKHFYVMLNGIMKNAVRLELVRRNYLESVELPRKKDSDEDGEQIHFFDIDEALRFLHYLDLPFDVDAGSRGETTRTDKNGNPYQVRAFKTVRSVYVSEMWKAYFYLAIVGGFRRGELCALTWNDIDFDRCTISISKAISRTKDGEIVKSPKTRSGRRTFILPREVFDKLTAWQIRQKENSIALGTAWEGEALYNFGKQNVFITETGKRINVDTPSHKFGELLAMINKKIEAEADLIDDPELKARKLSEKLPIIRAHDLRHTSASLMVALGINIKTISARLGHAKTSTTLDVYADALPSQDEAASDALGQMFFGRSEAPAAKA